MRPIFTFVFACLFGTAIIAQDAPDTSGPVDAEEESILIDGSDVDLDQYMWTHRPIVIFADSPNDPQFIQQMELLEDDLAQLAERDVVVLTDTDPSARGPMRVKLRPRGFMLALIVKDGTIYMRKPLPWDVREITRTIDKLPMRQQEARDRREQRATQD